MSTSRRILPPPLEVRFMLQQSALYLPSSMLFVYLRDAAHASILVVQGSGLESAHLWKRTILWKAAKPSPRTVAAAK